ncbi:hypothetical protein F5Y18DRAFT_161176 [Xylariaceae sp. FL1019]|nr:hypothetical protein F5Y18DRAFT_161176 [Xylariaceae sp. FL1019]
MHASMILTTLLGAATALAAPSWPQLSKSSVSFNAESYIAAYFNSLASAVRDSKTGGTIAGSCDFKKAQMPIEDGLPAVTSGLVLKHVAIGRGSQNYTCDLSNSTAVPVQTGALATLFNVSCVAANYPTLLAQMPKAALAFTIATSSNPSVDTVSTLGPMALSVSGKHFFTNATTPYFNLDSTALPLGKAPAHKLNASNAPADAPKGLQGETAVPWLKLATNPETTGNTKEIYRVNTAGGSAPATCKGQAASFEVQYAAEYWFWEST